MPNKTVSIRCDQTVNEHDTGYIYCIYAKTGVVFSVKPAASLGDGSPGSVHSLPIADTPSISII